ncbi:hypothetical protein WNY78_09435 [Psychroserpens sp. AS72]|uniref:hypothetical protein n=1 Tax=Psychroserpens sp. AS72 TaxID=3135775 RepID=UPI003177CAA5
MKRILITVCLFACLFSCSNDDSITPETQDPGFYALTVGNSWVYKSLRYDFNGEAYTDIEIIDSVSIVGTENIFGNSYFKFRTKTSGSPDEEALWSNANGIMFEFFREVDGSLVNENNQIVFTTTDYTEQIINAQDWGTVFEILVEDLVTVDVPAGTFECFNKQRYAETSGGVTLPSLDNIYYAEGIGLIYDTKSFATRATPEVIRRLDSYNVQ